MSEAFLHFIWKFRLYSQKLFSNDGQALEVIDPGQYNNDAGPDFSNARIRIGNTLWAGNVEIHLKSSDWFSHRHHLDDAYKNIILHVVLHADKLVEDCNGKALNTLELAPYLNENVYQKYEYYLRNKNWVPCERDLDMLSQITLKGWLERVFIERMELKTQDLQKLLHHNRNSLEETFYQMLAGNFGFKVNKQPFTILSRLVPLNIAGKHHNRLTQLEALYFGTSGLLDGDHYEDYPNTLVQEYGFLRNKYSLAKMEKHLWKFLRLRPSNFPTIRIAQFAALMHKTENLSSKILDCNKLHELRELFNLAASSYWNTHYSFGKTSHKRKKSLGESAINIILINTVAHFLFFYGKIKGEPAFQDRAISYLLDLPAESNAIIRGWEKAGISAENAFESQALIELKNNYCVQKKCLRCGIGMSLLSMA